MHSITTKLFKHLRISQLGRPTSSSVLCGKEDLKALYSTSFSDGDNESDAKDVKGVREDIDEDDFLPDKIEMQPQGVDPRKGWNFRGVHKAIICGRVGQVPIQKILRNGRNVTIFTVGTGGLSDQRNLGAKDLPKPAQWHRIACHNDMLGAYAVQQLVKNSPVYVEGDIETRVYNDSINGEVKSIPEICVRRDGSDKAQAGMPIIKRLVSLRIWPYFVHSL